MLNIFHVNICLPAPFHHPLFPTALHTSPVEEPPLKGLRWRTSHTPYVALPTYPMHNSLHISKASLQNLG